MEYSKENTMTRKEYLKSKNKKKFDFSKLKYVLLFAFIILLSIYLYKQLNLYNNVTKIANKVVEETALAKTMTMYYVQDSYTKDEDTSIVLYKSFDESRTRIESTEGIKDISINNNILYGLKNDGLYGINLENNEIVKIIDKSIDKYIVNDKIIYYYFTDNDNSKNTGVYKYNRENNTESQIISTKVYDFDISNNNIYVVTNGTTSRSILRYDLDGKNKKEISLKYIVSQVKCTENHVYFTTTKNFKLYVIDKNNNITKITNNKVKNIKNMVVYDDKVYYINNSDNNTLYLAYLNNDERVIKKNIDSIQIDDNIIYYKLKDSIGIYKFDINTKNTAQVTSARTNEYICKN